jgi:hypothetical protein
LIEWRGTERSFLSDYFVGGWFWGYKENWMSFWMDKIVAISEKLFRVLEEKSAPSTPQITSKSKKSCTKYSSISKQK